MGEPLRWKKNNKFSADSDKGGYRLSKSMVDVAYTLNVWDESLGHWVHLCCGKSKVLVIWKANNHAEMAKGGG